MGSRFAIRGGWILVRDRKSLRRHVARGLLAALLVVGSLAVAVAAHPPPRPEAALISLGHVLRPGVPGGRCLGDRRFVYPRARGRAGPCAGARRDGRGSDGPSIRRSVGAYGRIGRVLRRRGGSEPWSEPGVGRRPRSHGRRTRVT